MLVTAARVVVRTLDVRVVVDVAVVALPNDVDAVETVDGVATTAGWSGAFVA